LGSRQERLAELREHALSLFDADRFSAWQIMSECERYIESEWGLSKATRQDYLDWLRQELKGIFQQREKRWVSKSPT
jgi:hypothetical protein